MDCTDRDAFGGVRVRTDHGVGVHLRRVLRSLLDAGLPTRTVGGSVSPP
ncbi:hypothetical protein GTV15_00565 [Streptomyces sp. SID7803]|nr:hypothetical protein [Streptomyces sp. SID7803]